MKQFLHLFIFTCCLILVGCEKDSEPSTLINVETDFILDMKEDLSASGATLFFPTKTTKDQECLNTNIDISLRTNSERIELSFEEIVVPNADDCQEGSAPASADISIGDLALRNYTFIIDLRGEVESAGILNVLADRYIVSFPEKFGFEFEQNILLRVPSKTIWGFINHEVEEGSLAQDLIGEISTSGEANELEDGYYGWFSVAGGQLTTVAGEITERKNSYFSFEYEGSDEDLEDLMENLRTENPDFVFSLSTWEGKSF